MMRLDSVRVIKSAQRRAQPVDTNHAAASTSRASPLLWPPIRLRGRVRRQVRFEVGFLDGVGREPRGVGRHNGDAQTLRIGLVPGQLHVGVLQRGSLPISRLERRGHLCASLVHRCGEAELDGA